MIRRAIWTILSCALTLVLSIATISCGGSSSQTTSNDGSSGQVSVSVSPTTASISCTAKQQFTAAVTGGSNQTVTWAVDTIAGGNANVGTVSTSGLYTAPATAGTHTVTAVSVADASKSGNATVTVSCTPPPNVTVTVTPDEMALSPTQQQQFTATVTGTNNTAVTWSVDGVNGGNSSTGTISTSGLYIAPHNLSRHTVMATSVVDTSKSATAQVTVNGVTMQRFDNGRTGLNPIESKLNPDSVNINSFGLLANIPVDGYVYAQPLYVPNVKIPGVGTRNVVYVATENDTVYAFDADSKQNTPLWKTSFLGNGVVPVPEGDVGSTIFPVIGITGTPAIDPNTGTLYVVAFTKENDTDYVQRLHALDITTGAEKTGSPVVIQASFPGTANPNDGQGHVTFLPKIHLQRSALLLLHGTVYIAWTSHGDNDPQEYHGWIMGYDANTLQQKFVWNSTPNGKQGSIWQSGAGLSADDDGNMFAITSNGDFNNGISNYSDSFMKFGENLAIFDFFTPYNQQDLAGTDNDLGSGGLMLIPGTRLGVAAGKEGSIYLVNLDNMGGYHTDGNHVVQFLPFAIGGNEGFHTDENFSTPAYFNGNVYFIGENDFAKQFQLSNGMLSASPVALSANQFGHQGAEPVVTANGTKGAIMWAIERIPGNGNGGVLHAYDATNIANELYNSTQANSRDLFGEATKFSVPTITNGKIYIGTQNSLAIFGLLH